MSDGTWREIFDAYWQHYVKAHIPAQAFDKVNENFFRVTVIEVCGNMGYNWFDLPV